MLWQWSNSQPEIEAPQSACWESIGRSRGFPCGLKQMEAISHQDTHTNTNMCFCPTDGFIAKIWAHFWKTFKILNPKDINVHSALQKIKSQMYYFAVTQFFFFRIRGALKVFLSEIMFLFFIYFSGLLKICSHKHKKSCLIHDCAHLPTFILCSKAVNSGCFQLLSITER